MSGVPILAAWLGSGALSYLCLRVAGRSPLAAAGGAMLVTLGMLLAMGLMFKAAIDHGIDPDVLLWAFPLAAIAAAIALYRQA